MTRLRHFATAFRGSTQEMFPSCLGSYRPRSIFRSLCSAGLCVFVNRLLHAIRVNTSDKVVLISNYTQTLDLFERHCKDTGYPCVRLDGSTSIKKRHELITKFNDPNSSAATSFVFLLSSKAGGCGVNLVGANRLVLFDPDWNPANDKQRQICKDGLSAMLVSEGENQIKDSLSTDLVKDLFQLRQTSSDTHDMLECQRCKGDRESDEYHGAPERFQPVSFAMSCRIDFTEETQEEQDGRHSTAKKANRGVNHPVTSLQQTGGLSLGPSPVPARDDLLPNGSEVAKLAGQQSSCDKSKKTSSAFLLGGGHNVSNSSFSDDAEPSAGEIGAVVNVSSQVSASDGDSEDETSSDPMEVESSDTSGSDSN
ncbi:hypothetical protein Emag_000020 [Eimeria magna]